MNDRRDTVFSPVEGSFTQRFGARMRGHRPIVAGLIVSVGAYLVLAALMVGLGLLLTHVLLAHGVGSLDRTVSGWFVARRTSMLDTVTRIGSDLGTTGVVLGVGLFAVVALAIGKRWRQIGFLVCALSVEFTVFLTATFFVERNRPNVPRLDAVPPTSSYPSGHTAASIALYVGLAIVIWSLVRSVAIRAIASILAAAIPVFVGLSRLYRGMHHLTDVLASVLLGCGALVFALLATRSSVAAAEARGHRTDPRAQPERSLKAAS
jgi:membrane-associated phospholipid phosphatase